MCVFKPVFLPHFQTGANTSNHKPRFSHLTLKQVEQLRVELARMKKFQFNDRQLDNELRYYRGQMKQFVRAALKFQQPIAM